ncbi:MAG: hypothetical protein QG670_1679 [Thermoproteota archaeon]|nr:hypothetical protein [Thermoproteota archaeon]
MCEHLLCLYSVLVDQTFLYNDDLPFFQNDSEADVILYGFKKKRYDELECLKELAKLPINKLNIISSRIFREFPNLKVNYVDWDFHIDVEQFDFELKGGKYKDIRYRLRQVERMGYKAKIGREFTSRHSYILSRHMACHQLTVWDYEELLSLEWFFREHDHGFMMEVYKDDKLVGFDVVDFFEESRIMAVPLGVYLDVPLISYFQMHENLKYARENGYVWLDVGSACGAEGLAKFKEKWTAKPKYKICVQTLTIKPDTVSNLKLS